MQSKDSAQIMLDGIATLDRQKREISDIVQLFRGKLVANGGFNRRDDWHHEMHSPESSCFWMLSYYAEKRILLVRCFIKGDDGEIVDQALLVDNQYESLPRDMDVAIVRSSLHVFTDGMYAFSPKLHAELQPYRDAGTKPLFTQVE